MSTFKPYLSATEAPSLSEVQALPGLVLLEFGTEWCGHCRAAQPLIAQAMAAHIRMPMPWQHLKIEDGPGRALGRHYRVKLWPTLVLLRDGQEVARLVRPASAQDMETAMSKA
ncbi:thioredoxin family protein [Limnohabitans sp. Jir72]|uniref:thioredoxin family protein n=1 Tax=Limnohabitans sp. Jir72 TaxID=1977909 RepID=UPI000D33A54A|nr:thioredoxin family protein [Limnohabitans sp. Jir72]PUE31744.1 thiol reductase thioredoxin [Limnohabitans sp. Jir72]